MRMLEVDVLREPRESRVLNVKLCELVERVESFRGKGVERVEGVESL